MDWLLYWPARGLVFLLQRLPLGIVARIGRGIGALAYWLDGRHRRVALHNLESIFGRERNAAELRRMAAENFRRIGENYVCAIRTAAMSRRELEAWVELDDPEGVLSPDRSPALGDRVVALGHFGNFELFAGCHDPGSRYQFVTTYRALPSKPFNQLMQTLRGHRGCRFFERRTEAAALRNALDQGQIVLGLLADQHAGRKGVWGPFLGRECSTTPAPAIYALRYRCSLFTAVCYRKGLGRYRIEVGDLIPTRTEGGARSVAEITADINRAFETAVRRDPANWFWVHKRWKPRGPSQRAVAGGDQSLSAAPGTADNGSAPQPPGSFTV